MTFRDAVQLNPSTTTCRDCHRMVRVVDVGGGEMVSTDPELITVVLAGRVRPAQRQQHARRLHADRCEGYQDEQRRRENTAAMKAFTARGRRGSGL